MLRVAQVHRDSTHEIRFSEDENVAFSAILNREPYHLAVKVSVYRISKDNKKQLLGTYCRSFPHPVSHIHYSRFIRKFLLDPEYRNQYFHDGTMWSGKMQNNTINSSSEKNIS